MSLASTSKAQVSYIEEVTAGTTPVAGTPKRLRITGESLGYKISNESSKEINDSRQVSDRVQTGATADGDFNIEWSYHEFDAFLEALIGGTYTPFGTGGQTTLTCTINHTAGTITDDGVDGFTGLLAGQWFWLSGAGATTNAGRLYRISSRTNDQLTVDTDTPLLADVAGGSMTFSSSRVTTGTAALRYFSLQKYFSDVNQYFVYRGMSPTKMSLSLSAGALITGSIGFMGFNSAQNTTTFMPGAPSSSQAYGITNAVTGVGTILLDNNALVGTSIKSATINIDGKLRGQSAIGSLGSVGLGSGTFEIGGSIEVYLDTTASVYAQALANTNVSIQIPIKDVNGNGYVFIFPNAKLDVPTVTAGGMDADVMLSIPFSAVAPSSTDHMIIIDRFGAVIS